MLNTPMTIRARLVALGLVLALVTGLSATCLAGPKPKPQMVNAIMVGDRLVDIAYNLGVLPEYMSVRGSIWPMADTLKPASQLLGCPMRVTKKKPQTLPDVVKNKGVKRVIVEKSANFCIYKKESNPVNVGPLLKDTNAVIEYVDFSGGVVPAITRIAALLGKEALGRELIASYSKAYKQVEDGLPAQGLGKTVVILSGVYSEATGKTFLNVEAPGGYSDQYILDPLGCTNAGAAFAPPSGAVSKGMYRVRNLRGLLKASPDVIVITGTAWPVQAALQKQIRETPELLSIPALKNAAVFTLTRYVDSSVIEYPGIFHQWKSVLSL